MKKPSLVIIIKAVIVILTLAVLMLWTLLLSGCSQREASKTVVDRNGKMISRYHYKSNSFASETSADSVEVVVDGKVVLRINNLAQDNDSVKASALIGGIPVIAETSN